MNPCDYVYLPYLIGTHWLVHNGGRPNSRQPGYPYKHMRLCETKEHVVAHYTVRLTNTRVQLRLQLIALSYRRRSVTQVVLTTF